VKEAVVGDERVGEAAGTTHRRQLAHPLQVRCALSVEKLLRLPAGHQGQDDFREKNGLQVRLGTTSELALKLRVAANVLSEMSAPIRRSVAYVNVSAPARPTVGYKK